MDQAPTIAVLSSVALAGDEEWASLTGPCSIYLTRRWLRGAEEVAGTSVGVATARRNGRLAAALPFWITTGRENPMRSPARLLQGLGVEGERFLVAGVPSAYTSALILSPDLQPRDAVPALVAALQEVGANHGVAGCLALYARGQDVLAYRDVFPEREPVLINAEALLEVPAAFGDYPLGLSSHRRASIRKELRKFMQAGYGLDVEHLASCVEEFVPLYANLERKYGGQIDQGELARALEIQARWCGDDDRVFTARSGSALRAACLCYVNGSTLTARMFAADYPNLKDAFEYYALTYYLPMQHAMAHGCRWVSVGIESAEAKVARGAMLRPLWAVDLGERALWSAEAARRATDGRRAYFLDLVTRLSQPGMWLEREADRPDLPR